MRIIEIEKMKVYTPYGWFYKGFTDDKRRHYTFSSIDVVYYRDEDDEMFMLENDDVEDMLLKGCVK